MTLQLLRLDHHDRNRHGGGVLILVRSTFNVIRCSDLDSSSEILWIELVSKNQCPLLFVVIYRPPSASKSVLDQLYGLLCTLTSTRCNIVLCGDFNVPNIDWNAACPTSSSVAATTLCSIASDNYLSQVVLSPTHGHNILDLVFANFPGCFQSVEVIDGLPGTDHSAVPFSFSFDTVKLRSADHLLYNYKRADFNYFEFVLN